MILSHLFSARPDHPLGDVGEFRRVLTGLPEDAFKAVVEVYTWFESLRQADDFRLDHLYAVVGGLDEAAQPHLDHLTHRYLETARLSKNEERRLWALCFNYWGEVSSLYAFCIERFSRNPKDRGADIFKADLPLVASRLMAARSRQLKWVAYRYGVIGEDLWRGIGLPYLAAEAGGYAQKPVRLYPGASGTTCVAQQYLCVLAREASSVGMLLPRGIELADRLIAYFSPSFVFGGAHSPESTHWIDAAGAMPPARMIQPFPPHSPNLRFFHPGSAFLALEGLIHAVERGTVPAELGLGACSASDLIEVLRHLALYWAPEPPRREHVRHVVRTRMAVLRGFDRGVAVFAGGVARLGVEQLAESWVVENVSLGGFRAGAEIVGDGLAIGSLLCLQPEGGDNWVLGVVRRCSVDEEAQAVVGIQTLSRNARSVELRPRTTGGTPVDAIPGIWLSEDDVVERVCLVLPPGSFNARQTLEFAHENTRRLLTPMALEESGGDFEIGIYREQ